MKRTPMIVCGALLASSVVASAAQAAEGAAHPAPSSLAAVLPPDAAARTALAAAPLVDKARAELGLARATGKALEAGPHEVTVTGTALGRQVRDIATYGEVTLDVAKTIRLPAKAALDRQVGQLGVVAAEDSVEDAVHQTALVLGDAWFDWIDAAAQAGLEKAAVDTALREVAALSRRVELRDASVLELEQGQAALAAAQGRLAQAAAALERARLSLSEGFPELPLPAQAPALSEPPGLGDAPEAWRLTVIDNSHEIRIAESLARQAEAQAARVRLDRRPDPTVGFRAFREQGGRENGLGVFVSTPIGGTYRSALSEAQAARAGAARADLARVRRETERLAAQDVAAVTGAEAAWKAAAEALTATEAASRRVRRGYDLAERDLTDVLLAERQTYDARRAEASARTAAWRAYVRLRIDAHVLWADEE